MCPPHLLLAAVSEGAASVDRSGSIEGGEITEVSGGGVVGHAAGVVIIRASSYYKCVTKIDEAGKTVNRI